MYTKLRKIVICDEKLSLIKSNDPLLYDQRELVTI